jgi:hypothetical protein
VTKEFVKKMTSHVACIWPEPHISATTKVGVETFTTAWTWPEKPISARKKVVQRLPLRQVHGLKK